MPVRLFALYAWFAAGFGDFAADIRSHGLSDAPLYAVKAEGVSRSA